MFNRVKRLFSDLWWLILLVIATSFALAFLLTPFFLVVLPMLLVFFTYFAFVRYDSQGRDRQPDDPAL